MICCFLLPLKIYSPICPSKTIPSPTNISPPQHTNHEPTHLFSFPSISPNCTNEDLSFTVNTCAYSSKFIGFQHPSPRNSFRNGLQLDALPVILLPHLPQGRAVFAIGSKVPKDTSSCLERIRNSTDAPAVSGREPASLQQLQGTQAQPRDEQCYRKAAGAALTHLPTSCSLLAPRFIMVIPAAALPLSLHS